MIQASSTYKEIMSRELRNRAYLSATMWLVNQEAQATAQAVGSFIYYSLPNTIWDKLTRTEEEYLTMEQDYWRADGTMFFPPKNEGSPTYKNQNLISQNILQGFTIQFQTQHDIKGITIEFGQYFPTRFTISTDTGKSYDFENSRTLFSTEIVFDGVTRLTITPTEMYGGQQRFRILNILLGFTIIFDNTNVANMDYSDFTHGLSEEMSFSELNIDATDYGQRYNVDDENSGINFFETGQQVDVEIGLEYDDQKTIEWLKIATLYMKEWSSTKYGVNFKAADRLSFLTGEYSGGFRIYNRTLYDEAVSILTDAGFDSDDYWLDSSLKAITITNPMPVSSHANCLQLIANAGRCIIKQDYNGKLILKANFATIIDPEDITITGTGYTNYSKLTTLPSGADVVFSDMTRDFWKADGTMYFLPRSSPFAETGFVSELVADDDGNFTINPTLCYNLGGGFIYYSIIIDFETNAPQELVVHTFYNNAEVESVTFNSLVRGVNALYHIFELFDSFTIEFTKGAPNDRIYVNRVTLGDLSDYTLRENDLMSYTQATKEQRVSSVGVKVFTYETDEQGNPKEVQDDVWYRHNTDYEGFPVEYQNPLISTMEHAQQVGEWIENYYKNNISYEVTFRGEPRIEAGDIIFMENDFIKNLQVMVENNSLSFNGAFSGSLFLRQAINKLDL